ncbi:exportin-4-like isoform X1 [Pogonomyrmex barbatus]|uniref:Exportin-4 n=2 Tax=Pogonomyrmex barbatus TaxID=144034 RepID=A0A6I9WWN2_9HYME|nr:exportin-4-like isoform X1 [Pogonomyrmex barbatus]
MAEEMLRELEAAAQVILAPPNLITSEQRQSAETVFINFRKTKSPYQLCQQILESSTVDYVLFETAGLIKMALVQEWSTLPESDISSLRYYLLHYVMSRPTLAPYVKARILQVFAIIIKRGSVDDFGQERSRILDEIENLIKGGDLSNQILGCNILSAILQEYATTAKSSDIGLTWEVHFKEKKQFELSDMKKIFKFCIEIFGELIKKDFNDSTLPVVKPLLSIVESILTWSFIYVNLPKRLYYMCEVNESGNSPPLRLHIQWQDIVLDPAILDLFFTLYWKVRNNPQLAHHAMNCLIQLASLHGRILNGEQLKVQYLTNYMQRFLKLVSTIEISDQEANGITNIIRKINYFFQSSLKYLPEDMLKSFLEQITRLTCLFIECAAQEESIHTDDCLYMEAMEHMFEIWPCVFLSGWGAFPIEFCKQSSIQIFDIYLRCHLSPPEGIRNIGSKSLSEEVADVEDDDKVKYKEQLQIVGNFGRQVLRHSLPLLVQLLEDRIHKLRDNLNILAGQNESSSRPASMDELYEDLHWLILIIGHVFCMEAEGETALIPIEITRCSMEQFREGQVDINRTLEFLVSSQDIQSDISNPTDCIDQVIRLITGIFRLCTIEKTAIGIHLENILSPELSNTIIWFLQRWSQCYLLPTEDYYTELSTTLLHAFGVDSPGALWSMNFILDKVICNLNAFKSEPALVKETIKLLISLCNSRMRACCLLKSEQFTYITQLAMKTQYDFPQTIKRGLMHAVVNACSMLQNLRPSTDYNHWLQTVESLKIRYTQLISSNNFMSSYHEEHIKVQVIDILESCIGVLQGTESAIVTVVYQHTYPILNELPKLLSLYHNYQDIVQLILELFNEYTKILFDLTEPDLVSVYKTCLRLLQTYARCNSHRLTIDSTAEEDTFQDILLIMRLLTNLLIKDIFNLNHAVKQSANESIDPVLSTDVFLYGLNIIMPLMTMNLLKFPSLCLQYFKMIAFVCDLCPDHICDLSPKLLQQLLASVELGLYSFGNEVAALCCDTIQVLAKHIFNEVIHGHSRKDIMAPFLNLLISLILSHQMDSDLIPSASMPLYYLICCYQDQYQQLVQSIVSTQTDPQIAQRLANAFTTLTANIELNAERDQRIKFKDNFEKFIVNVQGFLMVK